MYPLHVPRTDRPARKSAEIAPVRPTSIWSPPTSRGETAGSKRPRSERRRLGAGFRAAAFRPSVWSSVLVWTSVFYLVADIA